MLIDRDSPPACPVPLRLQVSGPSPGMPAGVALDPQPGKPLSVPLVSGTPRYLLFRNVYNEDLRPPKVIANCSIMFQVREREASSEVSLANPQSHITMSAI